MIVLLPDDYQVLLRCECGYECNARALSDSNQSVETRMPSVRTRTRTYTGTGTCSTKLPEPFTILF